MSFQAMTWAVEQQCPDAQSKLLLLMLANYSGDHDGNPNICWPSIKTLAEDCSMSEDTVSRRVEVLRVLKLVKVTGRVTPDGRQTSNLYTLPVPRKIGKVAPAASGGEGGCQRGSPPPGAGRTSNTNQSLNPGRGTTRSIMDLKDIMEAKERMAKEIRNRHCAEVAMGDQWDNPEHKSQYLKLRSEIKQLNNQIASL